MNPNNSLVENNKPLRNKAIEFQVNGANVSLSPSIVRNYLTNGDGNVSDQEVAMFINLCKYQKLNPFIKDAYLIKYGNQAATIVTSKDAILKRAMRNPMYAGHEAGVIVLNKDGDMDYRTGAVILPGESLVGGWAKTYVKGYTVPIETAVSFDEYAGRKKDGTLNSMWKGKPGVMIRKVALVSSLREAFPDDLQGMYASEELNTGIDDTMVTIHPDVAQQPAPPPEVAAEPETEPPAAIPAPAETVEAEIVDEPPKRRRKVKDEESPAQEQANEPAIENFFEVE